ncbi:MAG: hypothetical protein E2590_01520 [Chryseobacterium sp.]|nr:hypothetical protein [Chryseobacterium sp.]
MKKLLLILLCTSFIFQSCLRDNEDPVAVSPIEGKIDSAQVGGATQPNQIWYDLSTGEKSSNRRTDWDLAFYSGDDFKVMINSSIMMAAGKIPNVTDINKVKESDVAALKTKVQVANFDPANVSYIDDVEGNFPAGYTAIEEIKAVDSENAIYLVNMGKDIYDGAVPLGSVATGGAERGWMKIQITRAGTSAYKIKFAGIEETDHKEYIINKDVKHNYSFFSLKNNKEVFIQPEKQNWDLGFTVFTNVIEGAGTYIYADFVLTNIMGGAGSYEVRVTAPATVTEAYNNFKVSDVDLAKMSFIDQRSIGANWRNPVGTNGLEVYTDRFYIIKDPDGFYFKLKFLRMTNQKGERGHPLFEYQPL